MANLPRRTCLRCQKEFPSKSPGNRICEICKWEVEESRKSTKQLLVPHKIYTKVLNPTGGLIELRENLS